MFIELIIKIFRFKEMLQCRTKLKIITLHIKEYIKLPQESKLTTYGKGFILIMGFIILLKQKQWNFAIKIMYLNWIPPTWVFHVRNIRDYKRKLNTLKLLCNLFLNLIYLIPLYYLNLDKGLQLLDNLNDHELNLYRKYQRRAF